MTNEEFVDPKPVWWKVWRTYEVSPVLYHDRLVLAARRSFEAHDLFMAEYFNDMIKGISDEVIKEEKDVDA